MLNKIFYVIDWFLIQIEIGIWCKEVINEFWSSSIHFIFAEKLSQIWWKIFSGEDQKLTQKKSLSLKSRDGYIFWQFKKN